MERWQGERFEFVRRMGKIFVAINAGVSLFQRGGTAKAMERLENLSDEVTARRAEYVVLDWKRIELNEVVAS